MSRIVVGWVIGILVAAGFALRSSATETPAAAPHQILLLGSEEPRHAKRGANDMSLLVRELARQAVLIAARDGLGIATRDQTLREPFPAEGGIALDLHTTLVPAKQLTIELARHADGSVLWSSVVPIVGFPQKTIGDLPKWTSAPETDYDALAASLEPLTRGGMVDTLKKAGLGAAHAPAAAAPANMAEMEHALDELSIVSQFQAVRLAHAAAKSARSPADAHEILVRGYANLGQLTLPFWNATAKVFIARSLLYAERLVAAEPNSPRPLWHRAYARAMAGFDLDALADLTAADALAKGAKPPPWVELIEPYCHYNTAALIKGGGADKAMAPLATFLDYLTLEHTTSQTYSMELGAETMKFNPLCQRILDAMNDNSAVGTGEALSSAGHQIIEAMLVTHRGFLPPAAADAIPQARPDPATAMTFPARVCDALLKSGDADMAEPSWGVLARLVQESSFMAVRRTMNYQIVKMGWDPSDYLNAAMPLIADHPYRAYIEAMPIKGGTQLDKMRQLNAQLKFVDIEPTELPVVQFFRATDKPSNVANENWTGLIQFHADGIDRDLYLQSSTSGNWFRALLRLNSSPDCPWAIAGMIKNAWPQVSAHADDWEKRYASHPDVRAAFALTYQKLNRLDDAIRNYNEYLRNAPELWAYNDLAIIYLAQGKEDQWLATLKDCLNQPDYGLTHAAVQNLIAKHFMQKGDYKRAAPYADEAAQTWAGWAMLTAADCHTAQGEWDQAEQWLQNNSERYDDPFTWYFWCQRTGKGHLAEASEAVKRLIAKVELGPKDYYTANYYMAQGDPGRALPLFRECFDKFRNLYAGLLAADILDQQGDVAGRDALIKSVAEFHLPPNSPDIRAVWMAKAMQKALSGGLDANSDRATADIMPRPLKDYAGATRYIAARFLSQHGQKELAKEYWAHCFKGPDQGIHSQAMAAADLRRAGTEVPSLAVDSPAH